MNAISLNPSRSQTTLSHRNKYATKPSDPAEITRRRLAELEKAARVKAAEEARARDPRNWGIAQDLATSDAPTNLSIALARFDRDEAARRQAIEVALLRPATDDEIDGLKSDLQRLVESEPSRRQEVSAQVLAMQFGANDIDITPDVAGRIARAKRWDVFSLLRATRIGPNRIDTVLNGDHIIAIDRMQRDIAIRHRTAGASGNGRASDMPDDFPLARMQAADRLFNETPTRDKPLGVLIQMTRLDSVRGHQHAKLLVDLSTPTITRGERVNWRKVVETVTGEHRKAMQAGKVREACDAIVAAYTACDSAPRARAA